MPASPTSWQRLLADRRWPLLMAVCALCVVLAYQRSTPFRLDLTSRLDATLLEGFYSAGPVRWTAGRAALRAPNLWPGQSARLTLVLSAPRGDEPDPAKRDLPVTAAVAVNGHPIADLLMNAGPTEYELIIPADIIGPSGNLFITLQAPTFVPPADLRTLALLVAGISATPMGQPPHLPPAEPLLSLSALTGLVYLWLRRLGSGRGLATGAAALVLGLGTAGLLISRPFVTPASNRLLYLLIVACLTTELTVRLGQRTLSRRAYLGIAMLTLVAFAIRLALAHTPGDHDNFIAFKMMLENVTTRGVAAAYEIDPVIGAYPPVHHYLLAIPGHLYRLFISPEFDVASQRLNFIMKQPTILLDMLIAVTVLVYALRRTSPRRALLIGAAYAFNPGIIYTTSYNGQLGDPLYALFVTLAVAGLLAGQAASTGAATALAVLTKPQASAFLPFLLVGALRRLPVKTLPRAFAAGALVSLAVLTPFLLTGTVGHLIRTVSTTIGHGPRIVSNAFNIWWLWGWGNAWQIKDTGTLLGPVTYRTTGLALFFGVAYGLALWKLWTPRKTGEVALLAGFVGLAFFMLPTEIHENYLFPLFGLLALAAVHDRRAWFLDAILAITWFFNLATTDVTLMRPLMKAWPAAAAVQFPFQVGLAVINVAVLTVWGYWVWRMGRPEKVSRTNATVQ
ncbi:MAG: hypothetical protein NT169_14320 [Chloroflexi bacterium]|nr:hypothetical protein [Chloroflexota bacterium]